MGGWMSRNMGCLLHELVCMILYTTILILGNHDGYKMKKQENLTWSTTKTVGQSDQTIWFLNIN